MIRTINIPVRALVEHSLRSGDLVLEFSGIGRAMDGIQAHQKIQNQRPAEYASEVYLKHEVETEHFMATIKGRIDGVYEYPDHTIIDEIKTTVKPLDALEKKQSPLHWGQVKVYAYIYALQHEMDAIDVQLTYYQTETNEIREYQQHQTFAELEVFFNDLLDRYLTWAFTLYQWYETRDNSIKDLKFPFSNYRPGQRRMALDIYHTIKDDGQLIAEAPTGIGKTMAAVFPAVKAMGDGLTEKFFYLTAKTTGRTVAQKALEDLRNAGLKLKTLTLTAKDKICPNPDKACNGEECTYARGYYDRINEAVETTFQQDGLTREIIETAAREFNVCPFEFSLELSLWMDGIIGDYNYAFDPRVHLRRFFGEESGDRRFTFLVDEANNLVDRSREMFSAELFKKSILDLRKLVKKEIPTVYRALGKINTRLVKLKKECQEAGRPLAQDTYPDDLSPHLRRFTHAVERWLVRNIQVPFRGELLNLYFEVNWFLKVSELYDSRYTTCLEMTDNDFRLKLFCIDPSLNLSDAFLRCKAAAFFSATLSPIPYFREVLGCDPEAEALRLPSPFPRKNLLLPVADRISTLYKYRDKTKVKVAETIHTLTRRQPGNFLVFLPSYAYLKSVYELYALMNPGADILVQSSRMSEAEREEFLEKFSTDNVGEGKTLVGFAVMGGIFGEGIDLVGDRLSGAVIVGVGLPGISLERELIKEYFNHLQGTGFEYAYLFPGMNRVFQAAGRVIRTAEDRGVVLLIGSRFTTHQYRSLFPPHWNPIRLRNDDHLEELLDEFNPQAVK